MSTSGATPKLGSRAGSKKSRSRLPRSGRNRNGEAYVTKREVKGGALHVSSNPPDITYQPWYPCTVVHMGASSDLSITVGNLVTELASQLDPYHRAFHGTLASGTVRCVIDSKDVTSPRLNIRLQSVRAWNLTGRIISLSVDDFSDIGKTVGEADSLCGLVDTGSATHVPAVGFELPLSHRNIVLRNSTAEESAQLYHVMAPSSDTFIVYTNVLWRCDGPAKLASGFEDKMLALMKRINANTKKICDNAISIGEPNSSFGIASDVRHIANRLSTSPGDPDFVSTIRRFQQFVIAENCQQEKESLTGSDVSVVDAVAEVSDFVEN